MAIASPPADVAVWHAAFRRAGAAVALSQGDTGRARIAIGAPLPLGMAAEGELVDVTLSRRMTRHELRSGLEESLPPGYGVVDLFDVWVGAPALPAIVAAAEYRCQIGTGTASLPGGDVSEGCSGTAHAAASAESSGTAQAAASAESSGTAQATASAENPPADTSDLPASSVEGTRLREVIDGMLAAEHLPSTRIKGDGRAIAYDLRPLILRLECRFGGPTVGMVGSLWMRLRHEQEGGIGRPDEVVRAIGTRLDRRLEVLGLVRERLLTVDQLPDV